VVTLIAILTLIEYLTGWVMSLDQLLFYDPDTPAGCRWLQPSVFS
jgi:hypothetical protein